MMNHPSQISSIVFCGIVLVLFSFSLVMPSIAQDTTVQEKQSRFLLLDSRIVEKAENAKLEVGTVEKHKANPLFEEDKSWEMRFDNLYGNVIFDQEEKIYKCWYSPFIVDSSSKGMTLEQRRSKEYNAPWEIREMGICYATSVDGITWEKPALGLVEYKGSKHNNIIWRGPHGAGIFKDHYTADPAHRYKTIFQGLSVSYSNDGIEWEQPTKCEGVMVAGDTHNNAFWAPTLGKYVGITRTWGDMGREVVRIESKDFVHWTAEEVVLKGISKNLQTYAMPVFFHGGVYLGLVAIHDQKADRVWTELSWSPDTREWYRISPGTPLIPCSEKELDYDYGCVYACANPVFLKNEIRLYYGGSDWLHFGWRNGSLCLATMRPDGFAGYIQESADKSAIITTIPVPYAGQTMQITADVGEGGFLKVSIMDDKGKQIATSRTISKTVTDEHLKWSNNIKGGKIQLEFELSKAKLYSFSFLD